MRDDQFDATLRAGAAAVAGTSVPRSAEAVRARGDQRRHRKAAGSALLALALIAGGGAAYAGIHDGLTPVSVNRPPAPPPGRTLPPSPRPHSTSSRAARMLPAGQVGSRASVPWPLLGAGWSLAELSAGPPDSTGQWDGGPMTLDLVDPDGGRYVLYQQAGRQSPWKLLAWSGDGTRALFGVTATALPPGSATAGERSYGEYREITLTTGAVSSFAAPAGVTPAGFTRPDGTSILALQTAGGLLRLQRYSLAGVLQATIASQPTGSASPGPACGYTCGAVSSPDGTSVAWWSDDGVQLIDNAGGLLRKLPVPGPRTDPACAPVRWWNAQTILAECTQAAGWRLWLVPTDGSTPAALMSLPANENAVDYSLQTNAWQAAGTGYVSETTGSGCPQDPGPDGSGIFRVTPGASAVSVSVPGSVGNDAAMEGEAGGRLLVLARTSCPGTSSLLWLNPATGAAQPLLTAPAGTAGVLAALPFGPG